MSRTRQPAPQDQTIAGAAYSKDADSVLRQIKGEGAGAGRAPSQSPNDPLAGFDLDSIPADELSRIADKINAIQKSKKK